MIEFLMSFIGWGAEWILYVLFAASLAGIALFVERTLFYRKNGAKLEEVALAVGLQGSSALKAPDEAREALESMDAEATVAGRLALLTLGCYGRSPEASDELLSVAKNKERRGLERGVGFFATMGANAPFLGLLGTVLGLTNAFHALAVAKTAGPQVVYEGISEALVTTVVGLLVAIPAVVAYNHLSGKIDGLLVSGEAVAREILAGHMDRFFCSSPQGAVKGREGQASHEPQEPQPSQALSQAKLVMSPTSGALQSLLPEEAHLAKRSHAHVN